MRQRPELGRGGSECPRPPPKGLSLALGPSPLPSSAALLVELSVRTEIPYVSPFPIGNHVLSNPLTLKLNNCKSQALRCTSYISRAQWPLLVKDVLTGWRRYNTAFPSRRTWDKANPTSSRCLKPSSHPASGWSTRQAGSELCACAVCPSAVPGTTPVQTCHPRSQ